MKTLPSQENKQTTLQSKKPIQAAEEKNEARKFGINWKTATVKDIFSINVESRDEKSMTPLHWAAMHSNFPDVINSLIDKGIDVNVCDDRDRAPLPLAVSFNKNYKVIETLILRGANVNSVYKTGITVMHLAAMLDTSIEVIDLLISKGSDINATCNMRLSPLHYLVWFNQNHKMIEALACHGANVNAKIKNDFTPLHIAVRYNYQSLVKLLINLGADPTMKNKYGDTAYALGERDGRFYRSDAYYLLNEATFRPRKQ